MAGNIKRFARVTEAVRSAWDRMPDEEYRRYTEPFPGVAEAIAALKDMGYRNAAYIDGGLNRYRQLGDG